MFWFWAGFYLCILMFLFRRSWHDGYKKGSRATMEADIPSMVERALQDKLIEMEAWYLAQHGEPPKN